MNRTPKAVAAVAALIAMLAAGACGTAAPVDLTLTLPLFRADSTNCQLATADTVSNLSQLVVYVSSTAALTDSTQVLSVNVAGLYGKPYSFTVQQPTWTTRWYWCITRDSTNLRACRSNVFAKTVTAGPPWRVTDLRGKP